MNISAYIESHEGRRFSQYRDCCGKPVPECTCVIKGFRSIGVGHNLDAKGRMGIIPADRDLDTQGINNDEIDALLSRDVSDAMSEVRDAFPWFDLLDANRQKVLIDMCFNLGIGSKEKGTGLLGFQHMLSAIKNGIVDGNFGPAADEMKNSKWYRQTGDRAKEDELIMRYGGLK